MVGIKGDHPLEFLIQKRLTGMSKTTLTLLDNLYEDHNRRFLFLLDELDKLNLPSDVRDALRIAVCQTNIFTEPKKAQVRKNILDESGESSREINSEFSKYQITPKKEL